MSLQDPADFAALTSALGSGAGSSTASRWNITESRFRNVRFHIFTDQQDGNYQAAVPRVQDRGGRRKVIYQFPFKDGQTTGDLGRRGESFAFDVIFFGPDYLVGYNKFIAALDQPTSAVLTHPVFGDISCVAVDWDKLHDSAERQALTMHVQFAEHTYTVGQNTSKKPNAASTGTSIFRQAVINAEKAFQAVNAAVTAIKANKAFAQSFINGITTQIESYRDLFATVLQSIYLTFSPAGTATAATDLPGVLPVQLGGTSGTSSNTYPVVDQSSTPFAEVPSVSNAQSLPTAVAAIQAQAQVNGLRDQAQSIITQLNVVGGGKGSLDFYAEVLSIKQSAISLQLALEQGVSSSSAQVTNYTTPRLMTIREVAFAIGLGVDESEQVALLNPQLESVNYIPKGTVLKTPVVVQ